MSREIESVERWTARLLKSTANKQVSLLFFNVSTEVKNVEISWNIQIEKQLRQWVIDHSNEIIKMLNELKDQQDMTLKCNEHWIVLQVKHIKRLKQLKINRASMNTLKETNIRLQETMLKLKEKQRSADQSWSQQSTESWPTTNHLSQQDIKSHASIKNHTWREMFKSLFKLFINNYHQFYKFLNSSVFTDEDELTWQDWRNKINDKLIINVNQFNNETICIVYMLSRLEDDAAEHTYAWRHHDSSRSYYLIYKLFKHLKEIYNEVNKNWKCRHEYNALRQADKFFNVFYFNFIKLFNYLEYDDCTLMNDLQNKINNRLQNALSVCLEDFTSLHWLKIFLQDVNSKQQVNYQLCSKHCTVIIKVTVVSDKHVTTFLSAMTTLIIDYVKFIIFSTSEFNWAKSFIIYYICKISNHLSKNCSQNKINTSAS